MASCTIVVKLLQEGDRFKMAGTLYRIVHTSKTYHDDAVTIFAQPMNDKGLITGNPITIKLPNDVRMKIYQ